MPSGALVLVLLAGFVGTAVFCLILGLSSYASGGADAVAARLAGYDAQVEAAPTATPAGRASPRQLLAVITEPLNRALLRRGREGTLVRDLARADLAVKPSEWILMVVGSGVLLGILLDLRFGSPLAFPVGPGLAWFGSGYALRWRQRRRRRRFDRQLGDTIIMLSNGIKAGYTFAQSIATVATNGDPPISDEFNRCVLEMKFGVDVDRALKHMAERNASEDFDLMITCVQIHRVVGGNLAEILDVIAKTIRERVRIQGEIRTLTAQARASGYIIIALPFFLAGMLTLISPDYFTPMFHETGGIVMIAGTLAMMAAGWAIMRKLVQIEV